MDALRASIVAHSIARPTPRSIGRSSRMIEFLRDAWVIARKDLTIEYRTRSAFLSSIVFALVAIVIFYFAWDRTSVGAYDLAPGVLWALFIFSGMLGLHRSFGVEQSDRAIDGLLAAPVS